MGEGEEMGEVVLRRWGREGNKGVGGDWGGREGVG